MFLYWLLNPVLFCFVLDFSKLFISLAIQHPSKLPVCRESQNSREVGPTLYPHVGGAAPSSPHWSPECGNETGDPPSVEMNQDQVLPPTPVSASRAHAPCRQSRLQANGSSRVRTQWWLRRHPGCRACASWDILSQV